MKKTKKRFFKDKKKIFVVGIIAAGIIALGGGGYLLSVKNGESLNDSTSDGNKTAEEKQIEENLEAKEKAQQNQKVDTPQAVNMVPKINAIGSLEGISLQAIKSSDGTILLTLYGSSGNYTVEKCSNYTANKCAVSWKPVVTNKSYAGHGGLAVDIMAAAETKATYMVYLVSNGTKTGESKPLTVDRNTFSGITTITGS